MEISIAHVSRNRISNKLLNTINQATQNRLINEFDIIKEELYKEREVALMKAQKMEYPD